MLDEIMFAEDVQEEDEITLQPWKVLIVDDEPEVHAVTKLALSDFVFLNRRIQFISAHSGQQACKIFREHNDIAVVLLDVVMETDDAGLKVAEYVRDELHNHFTRIILRTGQPGQAPEKDIIINYDINDYKSKTELTAQKLFTVIVAALRSYRDINVIDENRQGLEKIVSGTGDLFNTRSVDGFIEGLVQQLTSILGGTEDAAYITSAVAAPSPIDNVSSDKYFVFSGKGEYRNREGESLEGAISGEHLNACREALKDKTVVYGDAFLVAYCHSKYNRGSLLYLSGLPHKLNRHDKRLVQLFSRNVQLAFDNMLLIKDSEDTQQELLRRLFHPYDKNAVNDKQTNKVVKLCELLAIEYGLSKDSANLFKVAVSVNEGYKVALSDREIGGASELSNDEIEAIRNEASEHYDALKGSERPVIQIAALLSRDYHEKWDGSGYPKGTAGDDIDIHCRIAVIADVYNHLFSSKNNDLLSESQRVFDLMKQSSGTRFDPVILDLLGKNLERFSKIIAELDH